MMDLGHPRQRSVSHGSLHSDFRSENRYINTSQTCPRPRSGRRPLRAVNENASLLRSPGPLESMLKTTTETGDIGLFTIKPAFKTANAHQLVRQRSAPLDANIAPPSRDVHCEGYYPDDRKRLPSSYRDTTSEILSMYASDLHPSYSRSFSPSIDSRRSYSLTTCSPRQIPSQKPAASLQSQPSTVGLQRPRSPFPYPTRLKRPGIRPASPALTENGGVDYSKMVELDRVSHRTLHGSYRSAYPHGPRPPPPLSLRADASRSTLSLPSRASPGPYYSVPSPHRTSTPSTLLAPTTGLVDRHGRVSNTPSVRSSSLTSIVEMYQGPIMNGRSELSCWRSGSFYYDYSEEFDQNVPPLEQTAPLCPVPQRAGPHRSPMVLRTESSGRMEDKVLGLELGDDNKSQSSQEAAVHIQEAHQPYDQVHSSSEAMSADVPERMQANDSEQSGSPVSGGLRESHSSGLLMDSGSGKAGLDRAAGASELVRGETPILDPSDPSKVSPVPNLASETKVTIVESPYVYPCEARIQHLPSQGEWHERGKQPPNSKLPKAIPENPNPKSASVKLEHSHSDSIAIPSRSGHRGQLSHQRNDARLPHSSQTEPQLQKASTSRNKASDGNRRVDRTPTDAVNEEKEISSFRKRHRRNCATHRISTTGLDMPEGSQRPVDTEKHTAILSPEPISPARELRVKNSIPQLMKALPPLPDGSGQDLGKEKGSDFCNAGRNADPSAMTNPSAQGGSAGVFDPNQLQSPHTRFKLRVKRSAPEIMESRDEGTMTTHGIPTRGPPGRRRLKIRVSRSQLGQGHNDYHGTVIRSPALKQCNSLADLEHCAQRDLFTKLNHVGNDDSWRALKRPKTRSLKSVGEFSDSSDRFGSHSSGSTKMILKPRSAHKRPQNRETLSISPDTVGRRDRVPRLKLSFLRLRRSETEKSNVAKRAGTPLSFGMQEASLHWRNKNADRKKRNKTPYTTSIRPRKVAFHIKKWAQGAKKVVRSCVRKKKLDSTSIV